MKLMNASGHRPACDGVRVVQKCWHALLALGVIGGVACGDSGQTLVAPLPGSIVVTTSTSGFLKDDSYELFVNGQSEGTIGANDEMTISGLDPSTYAVDLGDLANNCVVDGVSVTVDSDATADASLSVACSYDAPVSYTLRFSRERPNLDTGEITVCPFGICSTQVGWDLWVYDNTSTTPHSVIRQNQTTAVEIAHLPGVTLANLTEADLQGATFTTSLLADPFDSGRLILIRTDAGNVYALGNPVEDGTAQTLTFDAALVAKP
jgi:hypothetical protein